MTTAPVPPTRADSAAVCAPASAAVMPQPAHDGPGWRSYLPAIAASTYLAAWAAGLAVWPVNLPINAAGAKVAASYQAHPAEAVAQYLLAEGLAGVMLGIVLAFAVFSRHHGQQTVRPWGAAALGGLAVVVSVTQCVIGLFLTAAATRHDIALSGNLSDLVNRLDGVKMLALAGAAAWLAVLGNSAPALPRWLRAAGLLLAVAITASGLAYLTLSNALAWTAYVSGPLLLLWVTGTGIWLTVQRRRTRGLRGSGQALAGTGW
jgi:hypothetical protein